MNELTKIGALWLKENDRGKYYSGEITVGEEVWYIRVFKNSFKEQPNQPDMRIMLSEKKVREKVEEVSF